MTVNQGQPAGGNQAARVVSPAASRAQREDARNRQRQQNEQHRQQQEQQQQEQQPEPEPDTASDDEPEVV